MKKISELTAQPTSAEMLQWRDGYRHHLESKGKRVEPAALERKPKADKDFKKKFLPSLRRVLAVYPDAKVKQVTGGIMLMASPPPIPYKGS